MEEVKKPNRFNAPDGYVFKNGAKVIYTSAESYDNSELMTEDEYIQNVKSEEYI